MKVVKGTTRIVWIFENFVVKLPRIYFWRACRLLWRTSYRQWVSVWGKSIHSYGSPKRYLFRGIVVNWKEFTFYRKTQSLFLAPTHFSLFGFLNIQEKVEITKVDYYSLLTQLCAITNNRVYEDFHTFKNPNNFGEEDSHLVMLDYGNPRIQGLLKEYGDKIFEDFDLNYVHPSSDDTTTG